MVKSIDTFEIGNYEVFKKRFKDFPYKICLLTREQSPGEKEKIYKKINENHFSIIIGNAIIISIY